MSAPRCLFRGVAAMLTTPADILIVNDQKRLRASLAELFASEGHPVLEAGDGDQALTLLSSDRLSGCNSARPQDA